MFNVHRWRSSRETGSWKVDVTELIQTVGKNQLGTALSHLRKTVARQDKTMSTASTHESAAKCDRRSHDRTYAM